MAKCQECKNAEATAFAMAKSVCSNCYYKITRKVKREPGIFWNGIKRYVK